MSHVPTPYTFGPQDFRGNPSRDYYISGDAREEEREEDDSVLFLSTGVAIVLGNETAGTIPRDTAEFLCRAANNHEALLTACKEARRVLAMLTTRLCLTDPGDHVKLGGQGPPWTLWTLAESLEDTIALLDRTEDQARGKTP